MTTRDRSPREGQAPTRSILAFGPGVWPAGWLHGSPRYHLHGLAGTGRYSVVYVEPPQGRLRNRALLRGERAYRPGTFERLSDRPLWVYHPSTMCFFHPRLPLPEGLLVAWNAFALRRLAREVRGALARTDAPPPGFAHPDLLWLGAYHHAPLLDHVPHRKSATLIYDNLPESPAWGARRGRVVGRLERQLLDGVDLALFTSRTLLESRRAGCREAMLLENAVGEDFFEETLAPRPEAESASACLRQVESLPRPRIGYVGAVNLRLDFALCRELGRAAAARDWQVVFAGGVDRYYAGEIEAIRRLPNVHVPGHVPHTEVPHLLRAFDVLVLPHVVTPFTRAMFPEKLPEYLATGLPIVSTPLPEIERVLVDEAREVSAPGPSGPLGASGPSGSSGPSGALGSSGPLGPLGRIAVTGAEFVAAVASALTEPPDSADRARRVALARRHTRGLRLERLVAKLDALLAPDASDE